MYDRKKGKFALAAILVLAMCAGAAPAASAGRPAESPQACLAGGRREPAANVHRIPVEAESVEKSAFHWIGEYDLSYGDKIRYNVSAETGSGLQVGLAAPGNDSPDRTFYTWSTQMNGGSLKVSASFIFSAPVEPGRYALFVRASNGGDLGNVRGFVTISRQAFALESVTLQGKTFSMISTKEQLLALASGQLSLDQDYVLQRDIDLSDTEWIPIGTAGEPFTGSFDGNGCEITGLTIRDPGTKACGLFGYADGAKIHDVTLRDYDIAAAGAGPEGRSIAPILVFGTDTECFDNFAYPKE